MQTSQFELAGAARKATFARITMATRFHYITTAAAAVVVTTML